MKKHCDCMPMFAAEVCADCPAKRPPAPTDAEIIELAYEHLRPEDCQLDVDAASIIEFARALLRKAGRA